MILYFSGTGNTRFVAEAPADALRDNLVNMTAFKQGFMEAVAVTTI
jgi:flavodoxin